MDGNGRWAKKRGLPRKAGHIQGARVFQDITRYCNELELAAVTYYAFSTENWARPQDEVESLMLLFKEYLLKAYDYTKENNRVVFLGDKGPMAHELREFMVDIETRTRHNTGMTLNIAINYGGRQEIVRAAKQIAELAKQGDINVADIDEQMLADKLYTSGQKDPDFILRPSGEKRISNFLLWQSAYAELVFMSVLWPDFKRKDLDGAIIEFAKRDRRFGKV